MIGNKKHTNKLNKDTEVSERSLLAQNSKHAWVLFVSYERSNLSLTKTNCSNTHRARISHSTMTATLHCAFVPVEIFTSFIGNAARFFRKWVQICICWKWSLKDNRHSKVYIYGNHLPFPKSHGFKSFPFETSMIPKFYNLRKNTDTTFFELWVTRFFLRFWLYGAKTIKFFYIQDVHYIFIE